MQIQHLGAMLLTLSLFGCHNSPAGRAKSAPEPTARSQPVLPADPSASSQPDALPGVRAAIERGERAWLLPYTLNLTHAPDLELDSKQAVIRGEASIPREQVQNLGQLPRARRTDRLHSLGVTNPICIRIESAERLISAEECAREVATVLAATDASESNVVAVAGEGEHLWNLRVWEPKVTMQAAASHFGTFRGSTWWVYIDAR